MAHQATRTAYRALVERLNRFPQGAPPSELLYRILELLFSAREADLVAKLPIKPFSAEQAAQIWRISVAEAQTVLDELAERAILLDVEADGIRRYVLPPPMAGFFEFSMMRVRDDLDQRLLAELFYEYINVEEEFITALFTGGETQLGRVFVSEPSLPPDGTVEVLDYERATHVIESASCRAVGLCYCRHKMQHVGRACDAPMSICMTFNAVAESLVRHDVARQVDSAECLDLLAEARGRGLVQLGENVRQAVSFICNCCACCCEGLIAVRRLGHLMPVQTAPCLPEVDCGSCTGCGKCVEACPVQAMSLVSANDPKRPKRKQARLDATVCLGCGVCVPSCPERGLRLVPRPRRLITPVDSVHRTVAMAIERGKLQHLLFDNRALASHRAMAAILGAILRLKPVQRTMASRQLGSRYLEALLQQTSFRDSPPERTA